MRWLITNPVNQWGTFGWRRLNSFAHFPHKWFNIPVRYVHENCAIIVMMSKTFGDMGKKWQPPLSPGPIGGAWPKEEQATWVNITDKSGLVRGQCRGGLGYALIGQKRGVIVANWGTNSVWDKQFAPISQALEVTDLRGLATAKRNTPGNDEHIAPL